MKRLHRLLIGSYIGPFILTFFIAVFLLLMQFLWKYIDDMVGKGLDFTVIAELLLYASAGLVPLALPLAVLLSSIMTFGNLAEHNELMAIKSAGISLIRIMFPLIIVVSTISIGAFFFTNNVMPYTNLKMGALMYSVRHQRPEVSIKAGIFNNTIEGYTIKVSKKDKKTSMLYDIMIYDHTGDKGNRIVTVADSATMEVTSDNKYLVLTMYHGRSYNEIEERKKRRDAKQYPHRQDRFDRQRVLIDMSGLGFERSDENLFKDHYQMLNLDQLTSTIDSLDEKYDNRQLTFVHNLEQNNYFKRIKSEKKDSIWYNKDSINLGTLDVDSLFDTYTITRKRSVLNNAINYARSTKSYISSSKSEFEHKEKFLAKHKIEWHRKFTIPVACLILFFIGAPLGAIIRKGGIGMPMVVSVLFFVVYYVIAITGEKSAKIAAWPPWLGMWLASIALFPLGVFLTYKAMNDSVILNIDTYLKPLKKFFSFNKKLKKRLKREQLKEEVNRQSEEKNER